MKKAIAFILLISLCYYYVINLMCLEVTLYSHKDRVRQGTVSNEVMLSLTKQEYMQYRHGDDELCIKGELFDIKKLSTSGNEVLVYCIDDKSETKLLAEFEKFFNQNSQQEKSSVPHLLFKFLSLVYVPSFYDNGINAIESNAFVFHSSSLKTISPFYPVASPPPRGNG